MATTLGALEARFAFIQDIVDQTLLSGVRVLILPRREIPSFALGFWLGAGATLDPPGHEGLAHLTARGTGDGTPSRNKETLDEAIDFVGGSYHFSAGLEGASGGMQFTSPQLALALDILADTLQHPLFPEEEVERGKRQITDSITAQLERPGDLCERLFQEALGAGSAYGHSVDGTPESIATLNREAVTAFHARHYGGSGMLIALAGDCDPSAVLADLSARLGGWSGPAEPRAIPSLPSRVEGIRIQTVDRPVQQANLRLGWISLPRSHPDYYPMLLLNYIYGASSLSSRIGVTVRDNQGLAYQVTSRYAPMEHVGSFSVVLQTSNATARQALEGVRSEMRKLQEELVADWELEDARSYFRDRFPLTIETNGAMAGQLLAIARFGLPLTHFRDHIEAISAVTKEDIQRAAQQYLFPDDYLLVAVAKLAEAGLEG